MAEWNARANDLFLRAAEIEAPAERQAFLNEHCGGDAALRREVEALLAASAQAGNFLNEPAVARPIPTVDYEPIREGPGTVIGPYKLLQQIGQGGFGVVYMAEQTEPVRRMVALKIIKPGMDTDQVIARFEAERQALALMDHPNIAKVLDAGATASGRPYFVMELVKGVRITEFCDKNHLPPEARLKLFIDICHAIQHAHHKGVIHRDIKPSNVMVTLHDGVPVVKVIDFGVAKATVQKLTERTLFTAYGQMIGTPAYMSPEQAEMSGLDIDTRSDVYSLGVLLYELLTGTTPLESKRLREAGYAEMQRLIREEEAPRPSNRLSSLGESATVLAGNRGLDVKRLAQVLAGDLDWVVMKALEKDRNRRYATPGNFAEDIERYLRREAILARPPSTVYKLRKFAQRNRAAVLAAAAVAAGLLGGTGVATWQAVRATRAEHAAVEQTAKAEAALAAEQTARKHTREALDALTDNVVERMLARQAKLGPDEKAFLRKVQGFHEEFTKDQAESAEARLLRAKGYYNLARIQIALGDFAQAEAPLRQAEGLLSRLLEESPSSGEYQTRLGAVWNRLASSLTNQGKKEAGEQMLRKSMRSAERLAAAEPDKLIHRLHAATELLNLGNQFFRESRYDEAEELYRRAQAHLEVVTADPNAPVRAFLYLSSCHNNLGGVHIARGNHAAAEASLKQALLARERLAREFPHEPEHRVYLANTHANIGMNQLRQHKLPEAEASFRTATTIRTQLVTEFPGRPIYQQDLAKQHIQVGENLIRANRPGSALVAFDRALAAVAVAPPQERWPEIFAGLRLEATTGRARALERLKRYAEALKDWDRAIELSPTPDRPRLRALRANSLVQAGQVAQAVAEVAELAQSDGWNAGQWYDFACVYAVASGKEAGKKAGKKDEYARRAVELLQAASKAGWKNTAHMAKDSDLDPLRDREDFKLLLAELEPGTAPGREKP
jgi:serine/threonine protein kinase